MLHAPAPHDRYEDSFHITAIDNMIVSENHLEVSEYYSHHRALSARSCPPPCVAPRLHHATTLRLTPPDHTSPRPHTPERKHRYGHQAPPPPSGRPHRGYAFPLPREPSVPHPAYPEPKNSRTTGEPERIRRHSSSSSSARQGTAQSFSASTPQQGRMTASHRRNRKNDYSPVRYTQKQLRGPTKPPPIHPSITNTQHRSLHRTPTGKEPPPS